MRQRLQNFSNFRYRPDRLTGVWVLLLLALVLTVNINSQSTANYTFTTSTTGSLTDMSSGTTDILVPTSATGDFASTVQNIGFNFVFMGTSQTQFSVNSNGQMKLGSVQVGTTYTNSQASATDIPFLNAFWDDLNSVSDQATSQTSKVRSKITGTAPNRCLTIEWKDFVISYNSTTTTALSRWQIRLYETTGVIEYVYGNMEIGAASSTVTASIGFTNTNANNGLISVTSLSSPAVVTTTAGVINNLINNNATGQIPNLSSASEGSRVLFTFTPPAAPAAPTNLTFSSVGLTGMVLNWSDATSETGYVIYRSIDGLSYSQVASVVANIVTYSATGLAMGTTYYWRVSSLNEGGMSSALEGSQSTLSAPSLTGTKYVGSGSNPQDYATLTEALNDLSMKGLAGSVVLELQSGYVSTSETFPLTFSNFIGLDVTNTLKVYPSTGVTGLSITGSNTTALIDLNNADYVTIDGRPGGTGSSRELTVTNSGNGPAFRLINDASNNNLKYCNVVGAANTSNSSGVVLFSTTSGTTGNDNNTIEFCDINALGSACGITSNGTSGKENSDNVISNNNVRNFYLAETGATASTPTYGIRLTTGSTSFTISGNSLYQESARACTTAIVQHYGISCFNTSGNNFVVTNNHIGGSGANSSGTYTLSSGAPRLFALEMNVGTTTASSVQGNFIRNFDISSSFNSSGSSGFIGIYVSAGNVNVGNVEKNTIGSSNSTGSIIYTSTGIDAGILVLGANLASSGTVVFSNNTIGGITTNVSTASVRINLYALATSGAGLLTVSGNIIGSTTTANSILNNAGNTTTNFNTRGVSTTSTNASVTFSDNIIANLTSTSTNTGPSLVGMYFGPSSASTGYTVTGNSVYNLTTASSRTSTGSTAPLIGIAFVNGTGGGNHSIRGNTVHSLSNSTGSAATDCYGIYISNSTSSLSEVSGNFIHSIKHASSGLSRIMGIYNVNCALNIFNNKVRLGVDASGNSLTGGYWIAGIWKETTMRNSIFHNSIYIGGTGVSGAQNQSTFAFRRSGAGATDSLFNNIFFNARSNNTSTGKHYSIYLNNTTTIASDFNVFCVSGTGGVFGYNGADRTSLSIWQGSGLDINSAFGNPNFVLPEGTSASVDLHVQSPTGVEGKGTLLSNVTTDYDGQTRSLFSPVDIGADAGNFTYSDIFAPMLAYTTPGPRTGSTSNRTFSVTVSDETGVPTTGALVPRIWFRRSSGTPTSWSSTPGVLVSGSGTNGTWDFTIDYSLLSLTPVLNDTYQFYFAVQDQATTPNVTVTPKGGEHSDVNTPSTVPSSPHSYTISATYSGEYTVGPSPATYASLTGAGGLFAAINAGTLTGNVTVNITGDITEAGTNGLSQWTEDGVGNYTLTIQPDAATIRNITAAYAGAMIRLDGCDRVTIDGRFGGSGKYLLFRNTNTSNPTINIQSDATGNTIRNCIIEGANTSATQGVVFITPGTTFVTGNDNNTLTENQIRDRSDGTGVPANLIYSAGYSTTVRNSGNIISSNELFNFTGTGVFLASTNQANENTTVTGNTIYQGAARSTALFGMQLNTLGTLNTISQNTIRDLNTSSTAYGIYIDDVGTVNVTRNRIYSFPSTSGSTSNLIGIYNFGGTTTVSYIVNNQISIIPSFTNAQTIYGIRDYANSGDSNYVYYNSVYIGGTGSGTTKTYAWDDNTTASKDVMKNNLFVNARTGGTGGHFAARHAGNTSITDMNSDNNVYVGNGPTSGSNFELGSTAATFTAYKAAFTGSGKDVNSYSINAADLTVANLYSDVTTGNLNIVTTNAEGWLVAGKAVQLAIAGLTDVDYNGNVRSTTAAGGKTSIGSHEFSRTGLPTPPDATVSGAPDTGTPTTITVNGRTIATITWYGSGLPSGITVKYYSGRTHPNATTGFNSNGYWVITQTGGTSFTYDITLYYEDADLGDITESRIKVAKYDSGNWLTYAGTLNTTNNTILIPGLSSFSDFTLTDSDNPLPVELVNFNAKAKNRNTLLSWETKTEVDNSGFEVERMDKDGDWKKVAFIEGHGTSNSTKYYSFEDTKLSSGKHSYRLKQIDNDGTTSFSEVVEITIDVPKEFALSQNYPNPFNPSTKVDYQLAADSRVTIELYSITGERVAVLVNQEQEAGYYTMMIDAYTHGMASGIYIYRMIATDASGKNFVSTKKLSLLK